MVEGARLESVYTVTPYRGFESLLLRHPPFSVDFISFQFANSIPKNRDLESCGLLSISSNCTHGVVMGVGVSGEANCSTN